MLNNILLVGFGGCIGSICRYLISTAINTLNFPLGTFTVNALGSLLIGLLIASVGTGNWYYLAIVGFCGGFTTFSTFSADVVSLIKAGDYMPALLYILASVVVCVAGVFLGLYLGGKINLSK